MLINNENDQIAKELSAKGTQWSLLRLQDSRGSLLTRLAKVCFYPLAQLLQRIRRPKERKRDLVWYENGECCDQLLTDIGTNSRTCIYTSF